jgi:hypothetical protein
MEKRTPWYNRSRYDHFYKGRNPVVLWGTPVQRNRTLQLLLNILTNLASEKLLL